MGKILEEYKNIDKEFFDLDEENRIADVCYQYGSPDDIFDYSIRSRIPILSEDFVERINQAFEMTSNLYKLNFRIFFDSMGDYNEEELSEITHKNFVFLRELHSQQIKKQNNLALMLCAAGVFFILLSIAVNNLWTQDSLLRQIVWFVLDIASTVPFWSAADIYLTTGTERRKMVSDLRLRFNGISFEEKKSDRK
jgi:hypothetical protein